MITREYIETTLAAQRAAAAELRADLNANNGAVQMLEHLLAKLVEEDEAKAPTAAKSNGKGRGTEDLHPDAT